MTEAVRRVKILQALGIPSIKPIFGEVLDHPEYLQLFPLLGHHYCLSSGAAIVSDPSIRQQLVQNGIKAVRLSAHYFDQGRWSPVPLSVVHEAIRLLHEVSIKAEAFTILWRGNYQSVSAICQRAIADGISTLRFINLMPIRPELRSDVLTVAEIQQVFDQVALMRQQIPKDQLTIKLLGNFGPRPGSLGQELSQRRCYCPAGRESIYIDIDGLVYPCMFLRGPQWVIGRLNRRKLTIKQITDRFDRRTCQLLIQTKERSLNDE
ncbi:MAG: SPASM domain-containing protein [Patescibacteria group bacterium]